MAPVQRSILPLTGHVDCGYWSRSSSVLGLLFFSDFLRFFQLGVVGFCQMLFCFDVSFYEVLLFLFCQGEFCELIFEH